MKIVAVGIGQCGCNIADEFYGINNYAKSFLNRRTEILTDAFGVNSDEADLGGLVHIPKDKRHRIVIGTMTTFGHGVGKINADAAKIAKECHSVITDNILESKKFHESDGIVVIVGAGGGTGSGAIGWVVKGLKERIEKPVYAMVVLPFAYEEKGDTSYAVINTATCLKTVNQYADAVFLLDNERFGRVGTSLAANLKEINHKMAESFYDLFCGGEEKKQKYVGSKVIDAGDIKQSLEGVSAIGRGEVALSTFYPLKKDQFREGVKETLSAAGALRQAVNNLSLGIEIEDARKILVLVCAPKDVINLTVLREISTFLQEKSPKSVIRIGDYPRRGRETSVTLVVSKLTKVTRMEDLYFRAEQSLKEQGDIDREAEWKIEQMHETGKNLPVLT